MQRGVNSTVLAFAGQGLQTCKCFIPKAKSGAQKETRNLWFLHLSLLLLHLAAFSAHRILEYPEQEGTHRDHPVQPDHSLSLFLGVLLVPGSAPSQQ